MNTEESNSRSENLHKMSPLEIVSLMAEEDKKVSLAVEKEKENIARAIEIICPRLKAGAKLYYFGAGTSGRLGVLDASECIPTFNFDKIIGVIAGGDYALRNAIEGAEDDFEAGINDAAILSENDVAILISASGNPKYLLGVAQNAPCPLISLTNNPEAKISEVSQLTICPIVGAEIISGSSRLKAGTSQKMVLNMISTATMVLMGKVQKNLMIDVQPKNEKLKTRAVNIVCELCGLDPVQARAKLEKNGWNIRKIL